MFVTRNWQEHECLDAVALFMERLVLRFAEKHDFSPPLGIDCVYTFDWSIVPMWYLTIFIENLLIRKTHEMWNFTIYNISLKKGTSEI